MTSTEPGNSPPPVRVYLLDDHDVVRQGVRDLLEAEPDIEVVGEAGTGARAVAEVPDLRPDVAVLEVRLRDGDGVSVCRELRDRADGPACLILTSLDDDDALLDAVLAGAAGYLVKQIKSAHLVYAVRTVAAGRPMLDAVTRRTVTENALRRDGAPTRPALERLTVREREVLVLIGEGLTDRQIGAALCLADLTVKGHVARVLAKVGSEQRLRTSVLSVRAAPADGPGRPPG
ncbi:response regulator [Kitasatospora sp. NPDC059571]|uniref:response regulator n=1 Tax=Kitasatospora sp. NPDC059571 TaxID=3346871 RepID=UPI0036BFC950